MCKFCKTITIVNLGAIWRLQVRSSDSRSVIRIVLPGPLSDFLKNVYLSLVMHLVALLPGVHRGIGGLGIAGARQDCCNVHQFWQSCSQGCELLH